MSTRSLARRFCLWAKLHTHIQKRGNAYRVPSFNPYPYKKSGYPTGYPAGCRSSYGFLPPGVLPAFRNPWTLPRRENSPPDCFLIRLSSPICIKKSGYPNGYPDFMVREMGLEPTRRNHTHLKRACLPFQHSRKCHSIICFAKVFVKGFFRFSGRICHPKPFRQGLTECAILGIINPILEG